jgi:hypothetical protein
MTAKTQTVTISRETGIEVLALLEAFTGVLVDFREGEGDDKYDDLYELQRGSETLRDVVYRNDEDLTAEGDASRDAVYDRAAELEKELRKLLRGNDALRLAELERVVGSLGDALGVIWSGDARRWMTPKAYYAEG